MQTGPLACLSLSSVDKVDKAQDSQSGIGSLLLLFPRCKWKLKDLKSCDNEFNLGQFHRSVWHYFYLQLTIYQSVHITYLNIDNEKHKKKLGIIIRKWVDGWLWQGKSWWMKFKNKMWSHHFSRQCLILIKENESNVLKKFPVNNGSICSWLRACLHLCYGWKLKLRSGGLSCIKLQPEFITYFPK